MTPTIVDVEIVEAQAIARVEHGDVSVLIAAPEHVSEHQLQTALEDVPETIVEAADRSDNRVGVDCGDGLATDGGRDSSTPDADCNDRSVGRGISRKGEAHRRGTSLGRALPPGLEYSLRNMKLFLNVCSAYSTKQSPNEPHRGRPERRKSKSISDSHFRHTNADLIRVCNRHGRPRVGEHNVDLSAGSGTPKQRLQCLSVDAGLQRWERLSLGVLHIRDQFDDSNDKIPILDLLWVIHCSDPIPPLEHWHTMCQQQCKLTNSEFRWVLGSGYVSRSAEIVLRFFNRKPTEPTTSVVTAGGAS